MLSTRNQLKVDVFPLLMARK